MSNGIGVGRQTLSNMGIHLYDGWIQSSQSNIKNKNLFEKKIIYEYFNVLLRMILTQERAFFIIMHGDLWGLQILLKRKKSEKLCWC